VVSLLKWWEPLLQGPPSLLTSNSIMWNSIIPSSYMSSTLIILSLTQLVHFLRWLFLFSRQSFMLPFAVDQFSFWGQNIFSGCGTFVSPPLLVDPDQCQAKSLHLTRALKHLLISPHAACIF
jgi:hypothetical protein